MLDDARACRDALYCAIYGRKLRLTYATPTGDSHIGFEVWLPIPKNWNGNYVGIGNPGFIGDIRFGGIAREVARGSAAASTDTGHSDLNPTSEAPDAWAMGHPEKVADWGHRAVHEAAVAAKALIRAYYGKPEKLSFWSSCHEGGNQALTEAQKYPNDYDGVAAGDPAYYITHLQAGSEYLALANVKDGVKSQSYIPPSKYSVIHRAVAGPVRRAGRGEGRLHRGSHALPF
jgi:Tannase and feruloyl esterase